MKMLDERQVRARLARAVAALGGQSAAARRWRVNRVYLIDMLKGNEAVSSRVVRRLGLRRVVGFVPVDAPVARLFRAAK